MTSKFYNKTHPWLSPLYTARKRCNNPKCKKYIRYGLRGIKCLLTPEEIKKLWFRDIAYKMQHPSIDRIDNDGNYEYSNCQFIEHSQNSQKNNKYTKIVQYSLKGKIINIFNNVHIASKTLKIPTTGIYDCINNKNQRKTSNGFIWKRINSANYEWESK